jgi:hypothetical protein
MWTGAVLRLGSQCCSLFDAEAVLLVDYHQAKVFELDTFA